MWIVAPRIQAMLTGVEAVRLWRDGILELHYTDKTTETGTKRMDPSEEIPGYVAAIEYVQSNRKD
jgi:hypothetical protein